MKGRAMEARSVPARGRLSQADHAWREHERAAAVFVDEVGFAQGCQCTDRSTMSGDPDLLRQAFRGMPRTIGGEGQQGAKYLSRTAICSSRTVRLGRRVSTQLRLS